MNLNDKTVIVTGAASGIGAALATRFAAEGARVAVADLDAAAAEATAAPIGGLALACDVTQEADIKALVARTEAEFGPIDLYCSNAGLAMGEPSHAASASNADWARAWEVHVMAHVYAARAVLPGMIDRGQGYLLQMASAAGLLNQIGDAAYSATKHAAVSFAESLSITHGRDGIKVSVICPQYVATPLLGYATPDAAPGLLTPAAVAETVLQGVTEERFLILPHPEVAQYLQFKSADHDKWLESMRRLRDKVMGEAGTTDLRRIHRHI
ncbi:short-chain dehydrogenase [Roseovarius sp. HI0049]|nr:short-chain dehydrogenase [Roseovarius sp. HI0049]